MMQRSPSDLITRMDICTIGNQQLNNFLVAEHSCNMQWSLSLLILRIHIDISIDMLFDKLDVSRPGSFVNIWPAPHQQHGCDCD